MQRFFLNVFGDIRLQLIYCQYLQTMNDRSEHSFDILLYSELDVSHFHIDILQLFGTVKYQIEILEMSTCN